jgi:BASS family bile acid:Na+ symporter
VFVNAALRVFASGHSAVGLPVLPSAVALFLIATLPVAAGMVLRRRRPSAARAVEGRIGAIGLLVLVVVVAAVVWSEGERVLPALVRAGGPALVLNAVAVALAWGAARLAGLHLPQAIAIGLECGLQNFAMATFVALTLLSDGSLLAPPLAYGLVCYLTAGTVVVLGRRAAARAEAEPAPARP